VSIVQGGTTNQAYVTSRVPINAPRFARSIFSTSGATNEFAGTRAVRVYCEKVHLFSAGLIVKHDIFMKGNNVYVDSFDSSDPTKSTDGHYDPAKYRGDKGDVATNGGLLDEVGVGNANIFGKLHTGPGCPVTLGPGGGVGTHAYQASSPGTIQEGYLLEDSNFTFPTTDLPSTVGVVSPPSGSIIVASNYFTTNMTTTAVYPSPPPAGGVVTNNVYVTSPSYPPPPNEWVTTNSVSLTTAFVPVPIPADLTTNIYTTNVTVSSFPGPGVDYIGGVTTNLAKGKGGDTYSYNLVTSRDYTYTAISYTFPSVTYSYTEHPEYTVYYTNTFNQVLSGDSTYVANSLSGNTVVTGQDAVLILPNGLTGVEKVTIMPGASLTVYAGGTSASITGNDWVNKGSFAGSLKIYCAPSVTSVSFAGNGQFVGIIAAPNAELTLSGGGSSVQDYVGSLLCKDLKLNGLYAFHFDEALTKGPPEGRFLVQTWDEVR
jgi:hypothetical protein